MRYILAAIFLLGCCVSAMAQADRELTAEVEALKRKVAELEGQNRALLQLLAEIKSKLEPSVRPAAVTKSESAEGVLEQVTRPAQNNNDSVRWSELISEGNRFKLYGFLRLDLIGDSHRPNNAQTILFITSEDPRLGRPSAGNYTMHPRLTRFGIDYTGPQVLGGAKLSGKFEADFQNGGSESRQIIRIRHAYLRMQWGDFSILGGQTWDIVSPLIPTVNNDTLMWNAGNVGDRRPQLRFSYQPRSGRGRWDLTAGIGLTGAIDSQDLDGNGFRDGEESGLPNLQARVGYSLPSWIKDQSASFGISGLYSWMDTSRPVAGRTRLNGQLVNLDGALPLTDRLSIRGEGWWGRALADVRGGAGQTFNPNDGRLIRSRGGFIELSGKISPRWSFHPGFTTDDPVDEDVPVAGRTRNRAFYLANRFTLGNNFLIGADYLRWKTNYKGFRRGLDNRINIFFQYNF